MNGENMSNYWSPLDEELAEKVMGWKMVRLSEPEWEKLWPAWPRETRMRLAWYAQDPEDACLEREMAPSTGKGGHWRPSWIPRFSTDMNEAMRLCEGIQARHGNLVLFSMGEGTWQATIQDERCHGLAGAEDPRPAMAIAKVALEFCTARV